MKALLPVRVTGPATRLVSLNEAKAHLRVLHDDEDDKIESYCLAAETRLDGYHGILGRALITQTWERKFSGFRNDRIYLPVGNIQSVSFVKHYDIANVEQTVSAANYLFGQDALGPFVELVATASWPASYDRPDAVSVRWVCGYGDAVTDVPEAIRMAALLMVGHFFDHGGSDDMPMAVNALLAPFRVMNL